MKKICIYICAFLFVSFGSATASELFDADVPVVDGLHVFQISDIFSDIYEKLNTIKWAGKNAGVVIESIEKIHPNAHIAVTDDRIVLVWKDSIVGNWQKPKQADWKGYGEVTTAIILKLRAVVPGMTDMTDSELYSTIVSLLMKGVDENGRYIYSRNAEITEDGRLVTSAGIEAVHDERGNLRVTGIYKGSAADNVGIREDDLIFEINGHPTTEMSSGDVASELAGFNSGTLKMTIADGSNGTRNVILRRASIVMADADVIIKTPVLELVISKISDNSVSIINEALLKYGHDATGIILDLRSATGEDERSTAKIAGLFMGKVPVLRIVENEKEETEVIPGGDAIIGDDVKIVVLTSSGTRGTAEALAAAFYENQRGVLIGTPTAGRARLATNLDLKDGGGLELFNREAKTGMGKKIDGRGIFPIVCLSNIRNSQQQGVFFLNVINGNFDVKDLNKEESITTESARKGCPQIKSGVIEDAVAAAISAQILTGDRRVYGGLITGEKMK